MCDLTSAANPEFRCHSLVQRLLHRLTAIFVLLALMVPHVAEAMYHRLIRRDAVMRRMSRFRHVLRGTAVTALAAVVSTAAAYEGPLFDAHMHYNAAHVDTLAPEHVGRALADVGIERAVIITRHPGLAESAMHAAPGVILPFLDVYRTPSRKETWMHEADLPEWVRNRLDTGLATGSWRGIGELHLFADDRHATVFAELLSIARQHGLPVMIHGDPAVIDRAYEVEPEVLILWAHAGSFPYPPLIADYLTRYPGLHVDLSMRSDRLNADGFMPLEWQNLLIEHSERFLIGADTFSARRWAELDRHASEIRSWLAQLPPDVADRIAHGNARRLFAD
jgi:hypothetical protein